MDKQNYIISGLQEQEINREYKSIQQKVIKAFEENHIIRRKRIVKDYSVLVRAAYLYIVKKLSYQRLSDIMACKYHVKMSDVAWKKQLHKIAPVFFKTLSDYMTELSAFNTNHDTQSICALDATDVAQVGKENVVMRIHTQLSLNDHASVFALITDNHISESVHRFPIWKDRLYLADRAYGKANQLAHLLENGAHFVIRISPHHIKLFWDEKCRRRIDFSSLLSQESFSVQAFFRSKNKSYPVQVVAEKLPGEKHAKAEKRVRRTAVKKGSTIQDATVLYSKWMIVVTAIDNKHSPNEIISMYRERWQIELFFKRAKTLLRLKKRLVQLWIINIPSFSFGYP